MYMKEANGKIAIIIIIINNNKTPLTLIQL